MKKVIVLGLFSYFLVFMLAASANPDLTPKISIETMVSYIKQNIVGDKKMKEGLPENQSLFQEFRNQNLKFHEKLAQFIDFEKIGITSMPKKWQDKFWVTHRHRKEFLEVLRNLIEEIVYPRARDFFDKYDIEYQKMVFTRKNQQAEVYYTVIYEKKTGEKESIDLMFRLAGNGTTWRIYDIRLEDQLWTDMFKNQFNHIITTQSYQALIDKMRDKLKNVRLGAAF